MHLRFKKDKTLMNVIKLREVEDIPEPMQEKRKTMIQSGEKDK